MYVFDCGKRSPATYIFYSDIPGILVQHSWGVKVTIVQAQLAYANSLITVLASKEMHYIARIFSKLMEEAATVISFLLCRLTPFPIIYGFDATIWLSVVVFFTRGTSTAAL